MNGQIEYRAPTGMFAIREIVLTGGQTRAVALCLRREMRACVRGNGEVRAWWKNSISKQRTTYIYTRIYIQNHARVYLCCIVDHKIQAKPSPNT